MNNNSCAAWFGQRNESIACVHVNENNNKSSNNIHSPTVAVTEWDMQSIRRTSCSLKLSMWALEVLHNLCMQSRSRRWNSILRMANLRQSNEKLRSFQCHLCVYEFALIKMFFPVLRWLNLFIGFNSPSFWYFLVRIYPNQTLKTQCRIRRGSIFRMNDLIVLRVSESGKKRISNWKTLKIWCNWIQLIHSAMWCILKEI